MATINNDIINRAAELGRAAFARGAMRVPANDPAVIVLVRECSTDAKLTSKMLDSWLRAWDIANMAEPVPGLDLPGRPDPLKVVERLTVEMLDHVRTLPGDERDAEIRRFVEDVHARLYPAGCPLRCESCVARLGGRLDATLAGFQPSSNR